MANQRLDQIAEKTTYDNNDLVLTSTPSGGLRRSTFQNLSQSLTFEGDIRGLEVNYQSSNVVRISTGQLVSNGQVVSVESTIDVNISNSGVNGLDTGTVAANTWYRLFLIRNDSNGTFAGLFSLSDENSATIPDGYSLVRRIGWRQTEESSAQLMRIFQQKEKNFIQGFIRAVDISQPSNGIQVIENLTISQIPPDSSASSIFGALRSNYNGTSGVVAIVSNNVTASENSDFIYRHQTVDVGGVSATFTLPVVDVFMLGTNQVKIVTTASGDYDFLISGWEGR